MTPDDPAVTVTLQVWRVPPNRVPQAFWRMAVDRRRLRRTEGVAFGKLLGTGRGQSFGAAAGDATRWAALIVWARPEAAAHFDQTPVGRAWARLATSTCRLVLRPTGSRGSWAGHEPFGAPAPRPPGTPRPPATPRPPGTPLPPGTPRPPGTPGRPAAGHPEPDPPVLILTRARLRAVRAVRFWRAIDPVAGALAGTDGLLTAFGVGEAPLGFQGTISVWRRAADVARFAYRQPEHAAVVARTPVERWYAEELFARFAVLDVSGDPGVIGWTAGT